MSINRFCYFQGAFYANVRGNVDPSKVRVRVRNTTCSMVPCTVTPDALLRAEDHYEMPGADRVATRRVKSDGFTLYTNAMSEWMVPRATTFQVQVADADRASIFAFPDAIVVQDPKPGLVLDVGLAVHRAEGKLHVKITEDGEGGRSVEHVVAFDTEFVGGTSRANYQPVTMSLPRDFGPMRVALEIEFLRGCGHTLENPPFFFVNDPKVTRLTAQRPILAEPVGQDLSSKKDDGIWMSTHIPFRPKAHEKFFLMAGNKTTSLTGPELPGVTLKEFLGREVVLSSPSALNGLLCIDDMPVRKVDLQKGDTRVELPLSALDGCAHTVAVKDVSGSFAYWHRQFLLPSSLTPTGALRRESKAPFDSALFPQTTERFKSLRLHAKAQSSKTDFAQLSHAVETLEGGYDHVKLKPLHFPQVKAPQVSIVIPAHNHVAATYSTLCSLLLAYNETAFDVIVVDDASDDETTDLENLVSGIKVVRNITPQRFIRACNSGAEHAKGDYIVLLNNDTEVTSGWLDELVSAFSTFSNAGLVGSKLLFPDGKLQDAGGIVWGTGNPWNYGRNQNPKDPRFCYARQVDYLSGAALMIRKDLWQQLGGLSREMEPMYFEDTDLAFKVRDAGFETWFVPSSIVYHYEGLTSGKDASEGFKQNLEVNRPKFKKRWSRAFQGFGAEGVSPDLEKDRNIVGRVLFVDHGVPRPDRDAGSFAAIQEIKLIQSLGYKVTFLPINVAHLGAYTDELQKLGVEVIHAPFFLSAHDYLDAHFKDFDAVYVTRYYVAQDILEKCRTLAPQTPVIFNGADLHFLRELRAAKVKDCKASFEQARQTQADELSIMRNVDTVVSYNTAEHSVIEAFSEGAIKVLKCPWVVSCTETVAPLSDRSGIAFLGSFTHHPNGDAVHWFVREILSALTLRDSDMQFSIYGSNMTNDIRALASDNVNPIGYIEHLSDMYKAHRVFVAPLRSGAGVKGKVLEALAHGVPCVLSPIAAEGIGLRTDVECIIAETTDDWVRGIRLLMDDDATWETLSKNGRGFVEREFSFERGRTLMKRVFESVDLYASR